MDWRALFGIKPRGPVPAFWEAYLEANRQPFPKKLPLDEVCFVVFDTETTGLNPRSDRLLSIGAVKVMGNKILTDAPFERTIRQEHLPHHREAIGVHGILPGQSLAGQDEMQALEEFLSYIGNAVLVGHHLRFDVSILNEALKKRHAGKLRNPLIDTRALALRVEKGRGNHDDQPGNYSLDALCERYHIPGSDRHTAAGDAYITAILLLKLLARLRKRGVTKLGEIV
jgi:DNA polymerase-3 subunit epsilon